MARKSVHKIIYFNSNTGIIVGSIVDANESDKYCKDELFHIIITNEDLLTEEDDDLLTDEDILTGLQVQHSADQVVQRQLNNPANKILKTVFLAKFQV